MLTRSISIGDYARLPSYNQRLYNDDINLGNVLFRDFTKLRGNEYDIREYYLEGHM
jgi:hypothetical protein